MLRNKELRRLSFLIILGLLIDTYAFQGLMLLSGHHSYSVRMIVCWGFWSCTCISIITMLYVLNARSTNSNKHKIEHVFPYIIYSYIFKFIVCLFLFLNDIGVLFRYIIHFLFFNHSHVITHIERSESLNIAGWLFASSLIVLLIRGMFDKDNYRIRKIKLKFPHLPESFTNKRIIQITDIHTGSYTSKKPLEKAINIINNLNADYILFTGDLVNAQSKEMIPYLDLLKSIKSRKGVFSVTGNHDYADYHTWASESEKNNDVQKTFELERSLGWKLLLDEHVFLDEENKVALIGVQNISGMKNFHTYGNLSKASVGTENAAFRILMSHDPTHWDKEVNTFHLRMDLTLSGHTHGMQFGIHIPGLIKWSPAQWVYKHWMGLYHFNNRYLYINPGLGFIGYPGRVGILPEITLFELIRG